MSLRVTLDATSLHVPPTFVQPGRLEAVGRHDHQDAAACSRFGFGGRKQPGDRLSVSASDTNASAEASQVPRHDGARATRESVERKVTR
jgi:hypothetical protein